MKIFRFETLDSTSSHATRLLEGGESPPFVVFSQMQTQGRGRSGKTWSSPEGGLYLTVVFDSRDLAHTQQGQWPLLAATAIAVWLRREFGFRATIKWPNDILYAGHKLAGILCESSVQGGIWGPMLLGVGINVHEAPVVAEQRSISIDRILGRKTPVAVPMLAESLAEHLLSSLPQPQLMQEFANYSIEPGQLWVDGNHHLVRLQNFDAAGALHVIDMQKNSEQVLTSVRHDYQWIYQQDKTWPMIVADIGNTLTKLAVYQNPRVRDDQPQFVRFHPQDPKEKLLEALKPLRDLGLARDWPVHAISVSDPGRDVVARVLKDLGYQLVNVPKRPLRVRYDRYQFSDLGIDRVAMVEAAQEALPGRNLIVVSAGTCVTMEVLHGDTYYLGGYVLPGLQMKLDAMHQRTARLPHLKLSDVDGKSLARGELLGRDTRSAMLHGVLHETSLAVMGLRKELEQAWPGTQWELICTGGDGEILSILLDSPFVPGLILQGVRLMVLGGWTEP
ncbi:MAG TPA: biotin--[acetyl-CoA-carboxylase] ligase [Oligoflexus sp.]|uniref:biotin--[acetyl-CoA-carboxylase] ligase n=1 Tax=Oligoflexus sp. TaxID=1971216 RepID=UPI002D22AAD3|nr:biotin--[acetyl-CoA-carboxylase] ligase [Oligoflexus sp.]HYX37933.1 biotin--[acetyl-CoA-carboxylase] ligase [Oligoflexus sp.]